MKIFRSVVVTGCTVEAVTGLALLVSPSLVTRLLLGIEALGVAQLVGRFAGIALIALAVACWPRTFSERCRGPIAGLLTYNGLAALLIAEIGVTADRVGLLLWPAAAVHVMLAILLAIGFAGERFEPESRQKSA